MTDQRPTPEQIEEDVLRRSADCDLEPCVLQALREYGYLIVHPDAVPALPEQISPPTADLNYACGWADCWRHIFGDDA